MHEVSLRADSNRMNAYNLAVVLSPNLVKSSSPARDVMMCAVPGGPSLFDPQATPSSSAPNDPHPNPSPDDLNSTTLGAVICICIQRYYEVFDEVWDRSEALPLPASQSASSSTSTSPNIPHKTLNYTHNDNDSDDIDDAMLVMPIGPSQGKQNVNSSPPSAWVAGTNITGAIGGGSTIKPRPGHRSKGSGGSASGAGVSSVHTTFGDRDGGSGIGIGHSTAKARSMVGVENGLGTVGKRGSISIGRNGTRKASGAGVEALGVTAEGFFTPPSGAPPVHPLRSTGGKT